MTLLTLSSFFFFNDTATTEIYTLSLHDALPIWVRQAANYAVNKEAIVNDILKGTATVSSGPVPRKPDRKSTRLNSSHSQISYAVFCLKKKKHTPRRTQDPRHESRSTRRA